MDDNGGQPAVRVEQQPLPFTAHVEPTHIQALANPEAKRVVIRYIFPGGLVEIEMAADDDFEAALKLMQTAYRRAKSGIIEATDLPRGPGKGIAGHGR